MAFRLVLLLAVAVSIVSAQWELVWQDEFEGPAGSAPDSSKWGHDVGGDGWGNQELEYYTDSTNNAQLDGNGNLNIIARNDDASQYTCSFPETGPCQYTSARLLTQGKFDIAYGKFEAKIKLPKGAGLWPAFWAVGKDIDSNGWPTCGEIDIAELQGSQPNINRGSVHGPGYSGDDGIYGYYTLPSGTFNDDFHVFTVEWSPDSIKWYVDGNLYQTVTPDSIPAGTTWVFDHPFFFYLNLAVGGSLDGSPDGSYNFPQYLTVDCISVYKHV